MTIDCAQQKVFLLNFLMIIVDVILCQSEMLLLWFESIDVFANELVGCILRIVLDSMSLLAFHEFVSI